MLIGKVTEVCRVNGCGPAALRSCDMLVASLWDGSVVGIGICFTRGSCFVANVTTEMEEIGNGELLVYVLG